MFNIFIPVYSTPPSDAPRRCPRLSCYNDTKTSSPQKPVSSPSSYGMRGWHHMSLPQPENNLYTMSILMSDIIYLHICVICSNNEQMRRKCRVLSPSPHYYTIFGSVCATSPSCGSIRSGLGVLEAWIWAVIWSSSWLITEVEPLSTPILVKFI